MLGEQEIDKIIYDEEGNIIDIIEVEEDQGEIPDYSDSYYESEGARYINTQTSIESDIMKKKEEYDTTLLELINLLQKGVNEKKLSSDDRYSIKDLMDKTAANYSELKNMLMVEEERTIREQIQDIKENMIPATSDAILDILTEGGTKSWLYKDNDDNVLIDGLSIPELTILINKLNLIALGDGEESQFQINPDFINMVVEKTGGGEGIKSISTKYYLSTSTTELVGGEWLDVLPSIDEQQGKYLWYKLITTYLNSDKEPQETQPICISSRDGTTTYTWIRYADDADGNGISNLPDNKAYIGFAYNKDTQIESDIPGDYTWSLIKGEKGDTGVPGAPGVDGTTTYTWIKYSDNADGTDMYDLPKSTTEYIGIATNKTTEHESNNKNDYKWSKFKGDQGVPGKDGKDGTSIKIIDKLNSTSELPSTGQQGDCYTVNGVLYAWSEEIQGWVDMGNIRGEQGEPGKNSYLHIKYSDDGKTFTANDGETVGIYMGVLTDNVERDSENFDDYTWTRIRGDQGLQGIQGEKGDQGIPGEKGDPGQATYFHIKYSANANGNPMTETPSKYIGTYVDYIEADSTDYTKYTWARFQGIQGEKGDQGIPGNNGSDGRTYYLHIKYSNDGGKTFTSNNGETPGDYIGVYTDTVQADSSSVSSYTWSKIKGDQGPQGVPGTPGNDGVTTYTWIRYADDVNGKNISNDPTGKLYIGFAYNKTTATESNNAGDYTWSLIKGEKGDTGAQGPKGADGKTTYTWIKYSDNADGTGLYDTPKSTTKYIGIATNKTTATESTNKTDYVWSQFKGDKGEQGLQGIQGPKGDQGVPGTNGKTTYFHIKYSDVANPTSSSQMTETPSTYIGTYVDYSSTDSTDPSKYTWSRFQGLQGEKGDQGIPGKNGSNGQTYYLHIKYSNDGGKTFTSNNGETPGTYIGVYTDTTQADSTTISKYTWSKIKGEQGVQGNDGRGVESVAIEYAKNQSTTTAPTSGWSTAMPSYQEGYYLWYRTRIKYTDSSSYVYSTPICDESWKLNQQVYTQYKQLADKFTWMVKSGTSQSTMVLTDKMYELISKNITLTADRINLNGYISANGGNFSIDEQGNIEANDLNVNGTLTCKDMNVTTIISPKAPEGMESNIDIHISSGDTITAHLDELPLNLNGYSVNIYLDADTSENVELRRHYAGMINIFLCGYNIKGTIRSSFNNAIYNIYGGETTSDTTNIGSIMPYTAYKSGSYYYSTFFVNSPNVVMKNIKIYGGNTNTGNTVGIGATRKSKVELDNITFVNCKHNARTYSLAEVYCGSSSGKATGVGWYAGTGSEISFGATTQAGGSSSTSTGNNGRIFSTGVKFSGTAQQGTNDNDNDPVTTRIATYKPTSGGTYRYTLYNNWRNDNVVRQGKWGTTSGNCAGAWFYGSQFEEVVGKNITKVEISVSRVEGTGRSASCAHSFQAHTHTTRPSGAPDFTSCNKSISLAWGESGVITITDSTILDGIKAGTFKGFGIKSAFDEAHYSALSNGTVKIYYTE